MFRYRLYLEDGSDDGEATYPVMIRAGEEIHVNSSGRFDVLDVVSFGEGDSFFAGMLRLRLT